MTDAPYAAERRFAIEAVVAAARLWQSAFDPPRAVGRAQCKFPVARPQRLQAAGKAGIIQPRELDRLILIGQRGVGHLE